MKKIFLVVMVIVILLLVIFFSFFQSKEEGLFYLEDTYYQKVGFQKVNDMQLKKLGNKNYILYTYNDYCIFPIPCETIFEEVMNEYHLAFLSIPFVEFKKTSFYKKVHFGPSVLIIKNGKIISYLDANSDEDLDKYQNSKEFSNWLKEYIYLSKQ